ncbi:MAG: LPS export ABC transporter permease LptF [Agarilytica sp.]
MIVFRYLARETLTSMLAVSVVLLMIIFSARFVTYLAEAATGKLDAGVLLILMAYKSLGFLELILPLSLFIGILLSYGRLYLDSEMTVLTACGVSDRKLLSYTMITTCFVALIVALLSLYLAPRGIQASEQLLAEQRNRTDFETLKPARFNELDSGRGISYAESVSKDKQRLNKVFIAELPEDLEDEAPSILVAQSGETVIDTEFGQKFLLLKNGRRYKGRPGDADYEVVEFEEFYQFLPEPDYDIAKRKATDGMSTMALYQDGSPLAKATLQWRLSLPILVLVVGMLAFPLSRTKARQGRYNKLFPAILIYMLYLVCLNAARGAMDKGNAPIDGLIWWVHAVFFILAMFLYAAPGISLRRQTTKIRQAQETHLES